MSEATTKVAVPKSAVCLGRGLLSWCRYERVGDRYGAVSLWAAQGPDMLATLPPWPETPRVEWNDAAVTPWLGKRGRLLVRITEARDSHHIGDLFRGVGPTTPEVGEVFYLTPEEDAVLFREEREGWGDGIGTEPDQPRSADWLDPEALYRAHDQTVELWFAPAIAKATP